MHLPTPDYDRLKSPSVKTTSGFVLTVVAKDDDDRFVRVREPGAPEILDYLLPVRLAPAPRGHRGYSQFR